MCSVSGVIATAACDPREILSGSQLIGQYLQHRGHEWAGIAYSDGKFLNFEKRPGLVVSLFDTVGQSLLQAAPQMLLMQTRFSTQGESTKRNAQPHWRRSFSGALALGANGDTFNYDEERKRLEASGAKFISHNDSEVLLLQIMLAAGNDVNNLPVGIREAMNKIRASYSAWLATEDTVYLFRDPFGNRPMYYMRVGGLFVFASEDCALHAILVQRAENGYHDGTVDICQVLPGEIIKVNLHGEVEYLEGISPQPVLQMCPFERIYFARPDSATFTQVNQERIVYKAQINWPEESRYVFELLNRGRNNADFRVALGRQLAKEYPVSADCVIAIPDSGNFAAIGFAEGSDIPYGIGLVRSPYIPRTFISPGQEQRKKLASLKYQVLPGLFKERPRVVVVDDSLVFGATIERVVSMCRSSGAKEVHVRLSCPPIISPCRYGVDMKSKGPLIAAGKSPAEIAAMVGATSLEYLSLEGLQQVIGPNANQFCFACWNNQFRI